MVKLSVITHVYNEQDAVLRHLTDWLHIPEAIRQHIEFIVIDDFSDDPLVLPRVSLNLQLVRVDDDVAWNQPGCRNLAAMLASAPWLLFFDVDNMLNPSDFAKLVSGLASAPKDCLFLFKRIEAGREVAPHLNCFLVARSSFFRYGPYDEDFSGHYGFDDVFFRNLWRKNGGLERYIDDIAFIQWPMGTRSLDRDLSINQKRLVSKLNEGLAQPTCLLRFRWSIADSMTQQ